MGLFAWSSIRPDGSYLYTANIDKTSMLQVKDVS
jgi:hypothetical protein